MDDLVSIAVSNAAAAAVLALAAVAVGAVYRRPALVHGLWLLVLLKLVTPPLMFIPVAWPNGEEAREEDAVVEAPSGGSRFARPTLQMQEQTALVEIADGEEEAFSGDELPAIEDSTSPQVDVLPEAPLWPQLVRIVWAVGALAWFVLVVERLHRFRRLLRFARPAPVALQERARRLAGALGLRYCPRVRLLPGRIAPMLWAVGGPPRLLVPADLVDVLSEEQMDTLLVHELAHLRRRDHWVRVLEFAVMGLYWWNPVVWYARRELREAEEQCCDAWVVSILPETGRTYASALLDTLDFLSTAQAAVPPLASGLGQIADLKRRLTMIMQGNTPRSLTWPGCLAVIALGLTVLPMLPSLHGQAPRKEEAQKEIQEAQKALERAKAALEHQREGLERKVLELNKAQDRLKREAARTTIQLEKAQPLGNLARIEVEKPQTCTISITLTDQDGVNPKEIVEQIRKALPENLRTKIVEVHTVPPRIHRIQINQNAATPQPAPAGPRGRQPSHREDPNIGIGRSQSSSEKRINDLEKKLEKVLRELQEMRKQMKQPHSGNYPLPAPGVASGYAAPAVPLPYPVPPDTVPPPAPTPPVPPTPPTAPQSADRFKAVPRSNRSPKPAPAPEAPSQDNPYSAPTVPLGK